MISPGATGNPSIRDAGSRGDDAAIVVDQLVVRFARRSLIPALRRVTTAVRDVSFSVPAGSSLALVGESGCGKTTLGRTVVGLQSPTSGRVVLARAEQAGRGHAAQLIFQNPHASLNPQLTAGGMIAEVRRVHFRESRSVARRAADELLELVGLDPGVRDRFPHQFSGGQKQRLVIARALAAEPSVLVCDEPTSALDVSIQGQILQLFNDLRQRLGLTYIFISHDLAAVRQVAERVAVMYLGSIVEEGEVDRVFSAPQHPYTAALLSAAPGRGPGDGRGRIVLRGEMPSPDEDPGGCSFRSRCWLSQSLGDPEQCRTQRPLLQGDNAAACHFSSETGSAESPTRPAERR